MEKKAAEIILWLKKQKDLTKAEGFVLGLSGGIDSSVAAALLMQACPEKSLGIIMPAGNKPEDKEDAVKTAEKLKMPYLVIPLGEQREALFSSVEQGLKEKQYTIKDKRMTKGNIGARLRMTTLYAIGNSLNYLVVGTDNAAETYTGYFTKYGDGGVDILPLAHLLKREVFALGAYFGLPESVIIKPPSAGFFTEQSDEAEMGVSYAVIDEYLSGREIPAADREIIEGLHRNSEHKRKLPPGLISADNK